jgi:hypothetical protein
VAQQIAECPAGWRTDLRHDFMSALLWIILLNYALFMPIKTPLLVQGLASYAQRLCCTSPGYFSRFL